MLLHLLRWSIFTASLLVIVTTGLLVTSRQQSGESLLLYHTPGQDVYVTRMEGQPLAQMVAFDKIAAQTPVWSPQGNQAAFISGSYTDLRTNIYLVDTLGNHAERLTANEDDVPRHQSLAWSPDGAWLAYAYINDQGRFYVRLLSPDGLQSMTFLQASQGSFWRIEFDSLRWSPDGRRLSMIVTPEPDAPKYLAFLDPQTGIYTLHRLPFDWTSPPEWSPDGKWLAFVTYAKQFNDTAIYRVRVDDKHIERLVGGYTSILSSTVQNVLAWSPDSRSILFVAKFGHLNSIFRVDVARRESTRVSRGIADDKSPIWSPDGTWIYFASLRDQTRGIYRMRPDGTNVEKMVDTGNHEFYPIIGSMQTRPLHIWPLVGVGIVAFVFSLWHLISGHRSLSKIP